jgi:hypothetical protein
MKAGKVIRLKSPKASKNPRIRLEVIEDRFYGPCQQRENLPAVQRTFSLIILSIRTKLQATINVSTEFEKVCVCKVHVT